MRWLPGGQFVMGSEHFYPEEAPLRRVRVDGFWIDETPVTNAEFARFVAATGHVTFAEIAPDPALVPGLPPGMDRAGSLVFHPSPGAAGWSHPLHWWRFEFGAHWRQPLGPGSSLADLQDHPVVHIAHADAQAYALWAGKQLPTEAEWEYAARGGLEQADYAWGDELAPAGRMMANYWQGLFPFDNRRLDGWERTSPVHAFSPNGHGLYDMIGNVWEWTQDWWLDAGRTPPAHSPCCAIDNPRGGTREQSLQAGQPHKVIKGGSHLCAPNHCRRYRPAARQPQTPDTSSSHMGFRCVVRADGSGRCAHGGAP